MNTIQIKQWQHVVCCPECRGGCKIPEQEYNSKEDLNRDRQEKEGDRDREKLFEDVIF